MSLIEKIEAKWGAVPPNDRRALSMCIGFLLLVTGYVGLFEPLLNRYETANNNLAELQDRQSSNARKIALLQKREARLAEYRGQRDELEQRFELEVESVDQAVSRTLAEFTYYARLSDIDISGVRPESEKIVGEYIELPFELEASGDYNSLRKFIYYIDTSPSVLAVSRLQLTPTTDGILRADLQVTDVIRLGTSDANQSEGQLASSHRLRLVIPDWPGYLPFWIAQYEGYLESDLYNIELVTERDKITLERLMLSGQVDGVGLTFADLLGYWVKGIPLKIVKPVSQAYGTEGIVVSADSGIRVLGDLRGQRMGVDEQGLLPFVLHQALQESELAADSLVRVPREASQVARDIRSGLLVAGVTREPWLSKLVADGVVRQIYGSGGLFRGVLDLFAIYSPGNEDKRQVVQFLINALYRAEQFMDQNHDQAMQILANRMGTSTAIAEEYFGKISPFNKAESTLFFAGEETADRLLTYEQYFDETDQPIPLITASDILDPSYIQVLTSESADE